MSMNGDPFQQPWTRESRTGNFLARFGAGTDGYDVALALPTEAPPDQGWPLVVVTDAAIHFDAVAAAAAALSRRPEKTNVTPLAVLGIASGLDWSHDQARRVRSYVPDADGDPDGLLSLIGNEVLSAVSVLTPVDPGEISIVGHSFGGLFALHALGARPDLIRRCVAVSPSLWKAPDVARRLAAKGDAMSARLMIVSGATEERINDALREPMDAFERAGMHVERLMLAGEDHGSSYFAALPAVLRFLRRTGAETR